MFYSLEVNVRLEGKEKTLPWIMNIVEGLPKTKMLRAAIKSLRTSTA